MTSSKFTITAWLVSALSPVNHHCMAWWFTIINILHDMTTHHCHQTGWHHHDLSCQTEWNHDNSLQLPDWMTSSWVTIIIILHDISNHHHHQAARNHNSLWTPNCMISQFSLPIQLLDIITIHHHKTAWHHHDSPSPPDSMSGLRTSILPGFIVMNKPQDQTRLISRPSNTKRSWLAERALRMHRICWATTDNTSMLMRLNSSKHPHAPVWYKGNHTQQWIGGSKSMTCINCKRREERKNQY